MKIHLDIMTIWLMLVWIEMDITQIWSTGFCTQWEKYCSLRCGECDDIQDKENRIYKELKTQIFDSIFNLCRCYKRNSQ